MKLLEDRILKDGVVRPGGVLKVDSFLNHQIDVPFIEELCKEFIGHFGGSRVGKILTIEASGIGIACIAAVRFGVPAVFAKKSAGTNMDEDVYSARVYSYTHNRTENVIVSKKFISPGDRILIIDDFLANGSAAEGLLGIIEEAGAVAVGIGVAVEKGFQGGGDRLREAGIDVCSLAVIDRMDAENGTIEFRRR